MCKIKDCGRTRWARGWCQAHYKRWRKYGSPHKIARPKTHCVNGHPFNRRNTYVRASGKRDCRECQRFFARKWVRTHKPRTVWNEWRRQYQREVRAGLRTPTPRRRPPIQSQAFDLLIIEGGWWTIEGAALRLKCNPVSLSQALYRLAKQGLLESRRVGLATGKNRQGLDSRKEWKAVDQMVLAFDD